MPVGGPLFGNAATGPGSTGGNKHLVEMRAGKMNLKGRMVYPDKRKGLLYVYQSEDSLMHFCWQDRTTGIVEDDLIIFPDDCEYVKVPQCTTGRAYLLKFKSSNKKFFFWLQEPRTEKDDDNCKRINELLNNPSSAVQSNHNPDQDLQSLLNNMSQTQLMQLFGSGMGQVGGLTSLLGTIRGPNSSSGSARTNSTTPAITHRPSTNTPPATNQTAPAAANLTTPSAPVPVPSSDAPARNTRSSVGGAAARTSEQAPSTPIQLSDLQNFLQGIAPVDLSTAFTSEALSGVLSSPDALQQLQNHLPPQAVSQFSSALESGQLGPVVSQFAVNPEAVEAATQGNMQDFVKALEKSSDTEQKGSKDEKKKDDDDDEQMQLD